MLIGQSRLPRRPDRLAVPALSQQGQRQPGYVNADVEKWIEQAQV